MKGGSRGTLLEGLFEVLEFSNRVPPKVPLGLILGDGSCGYNIRSRLSSGHRLFYPGPSDKDPESTPGRKIGEVEKSGEDLKVVSSFGRTSKDLNESFLVTILLILFSPPSFTNP